MIYFGLSICQSHEGNQIKSLSRKSAHELVIALLNIAADILINNAGFIAQNMPDFIITSPARDKTNILTKSGPTPWPFHRATG